jgi:YwiC-like protein
MMTDTAATTIRPQPAHRSGWQAVAMPTEHGGWGLTAEPIVLGLLLAPSIAGVCLGAATMLAFLLRTPLRIALVDRHRHRTLDRTRLARRVALVEGAVLVALVGAAALSSPHPFWWPVVAAAPLVGVELWFDARSRSRRLVPELAGAIGVSAAAAVIVVAGGHGAAEGSAAWLILAARSVTAIPYVRVQIARVHHRPRAPRLEVVADATAVGLAATAVAVHPAFLAGAVAVAVVIVVQRVTAQHSVPAKVLGMRQSALGALVVTVTALGVHLA